MDMVKIVYISTVHVVIGPMFVLYVLYVANNLALLLRREHFLRSKNVRMYALHFPD
jgi:hypothetical protein